MDPLRQRVSSRSCCLAAKLKYFIYPSISWLVVAHDVVVIGRACAVRLSNTWCQGRSDLFFPNSTFPGSCAPCAGYFTNFSDSYKMNSSIYSFHPFLVDEQPDPLDNMAVKRLNLSGLEELEDAEDDEEDCEEEVN